MDCTTELANLATTASTYPAAYASIIRELGSIWDTTEAVEPGAIGKPCAILLGDRAIERHNRHEWPPRFVDSWHTDRGAG